MVWVTVASLQAACAPPHCSVLLGIVHREFAVITLAILLVTLAHKHLEPALLLPTEAIQVVIQLIFFSFEQPISNYG